MKRILSTITFCVLVIVLYTLQMNRSTATAPKKQIRITKINGKPVQATKPIRITKINSIPVQNIPAASPSSLPIVATTVPSSPTPIVPNNTNALIWKIDDKEVDLSKLSEGTTQEIANNLYQKVDEIITKFLETQKSRDF